MSLSQEWMSCRTGLKVCIMAIVTTRTSFYLKSPSDVPNACTPNGVFQWMCCKPCSQCNCISFTWFNQLSWKSKPIDSIIGKKFLVIKEKTVTKHAQEILPDRPGCQFSNPFRFQRYSPDVSLLQKVPFPFDRKVCSILLDACLQLHN